MNNLILKGRTTVSGMSFHYIEGGFGENKKAMLAKDIAAIHGRDLKVINQAINMNRKRFINGVDIVDLKSVNLIDPLLEAGIFTKQSIANSNSIYLLSERGYSKLLKILEDDVAWEQYEKLVDGYFTLRSEKQETISELERLKVEAQKERSRAMLLNAQNRTLKTLMQTIDNKKLSPIAIEVFGLKSIQEVTGIDMGQYLPVCEKTYSATEIGEKLGISAWLVGSSAKKHGLKTEKYGIQVMDKSRHSNKEVPNFRYYESVVPVLKAILQQSI